MGRKGTSISLIGIFGLLAYLTSSSSPLPLANYIPSTINFFGYFVPTNWFILMLGFVPVALGLLPEDKTEVSV